MRNFFIFLLAVVLILPSTTAFNCTPLHGENKNICNYIERQPWSQGEKDSVIQEAIRSGASVDGDFVSIVGKPVKDIELNKIEDSDLKISDEDKKFLIDFSSIGIFGYVIYSFLRKYYLLMRFL